MTSAEFKAARKKLGLSAAGMARELGMNGKWDDRTIRRYESGQHPIPGPVAVAVRMLLRHRK